MRYTTAGESHGQALTVIVSDVPYGFALSKAMIDADLARRQSGYGRGNRQNIEKDEAELTSGLRFGRTLGSPIAIHIKNRDWVNWQEDMAVFGRAPKDLRRELTPRPGHADLPGVQKTASQDCRDILERASARESAARVAAGAVAKAWLANFGVEIRSYVTSIGTVVLAEELIARKGAVFSTDKIETSPLRCPDPKTTDLMMAEIDQAKADGESLGGCFNVTASGLVPGIGGYSEAHLRLDGRLAGALMSIPAIKGVQFGLGFAAARLPGSRVHDAIIATDAGDGKISPIRASNNAGGLEGGMTNGEILVANCAMKPIPTLTNPLSTVSLKTGERALASRERSDICAVPAAAVVAEAEVAMVLADCYCRKFGYDCLSDSLVAFEHYLERLSARSFMGAEKR
jgi:chorismate synthase